MDIMNFINYEIPQLDTPAPIVVIGAGSIVRDAHLPAYRIAGFDVKGLFDLDHERAVALALAFDISTVYESIPEMVQKNGTDVVYDVAVPGGAILDVLALLPDHCHVLLQKPMGENLTEAAAILSLCQRKRLVAAVNFQLRYAPYIVMAKKLLATGIIGEVCDIEIHLNVFTPWYVWEFLYSSERVEILYHSIHYIDLIRHILGNPHGIFAKTTKHPRMKELHSVRSNIIMDYGDYVRANIVTNHTHDFGTDHQESYLKIEGTKGAIKVRMGLNMNYPAGEDDRFEYVIASDLTSPKWNTVPINGSWFPHGFIGSMAQLLSVKHDSGCVLDNSVADSYCTMLCVEAAYKSVVPAIDWSR